MTELINKSTHGGTGMTMEWIQNMNNSAVDTYKSYYKIARTTDIDPTSFIINMYKMLSTKYEFVITYDHLSKNPTSKYYDVVRPNVFINGEFIVGLNWCTNKWNALQQVLITFCNSEWSKLYYDTKFNHTNFDVDINSITDKKLSGLFEETLA